MSEINNGYLHHSQLLMISSEVAEYIMTTHHQVSAHELYNTNATGDLEGLRDDYEDDYCTILDDIQHLIEFSVEVRNE